MKTVDIVRMLSVFLTQYNFSLCIRREIEMKSVLEQTQSIVTFFCGIMLLATLFMPWIKMPSFFLMGEYVSFQANGWNVINGELPWISPAGPMLTLISGILMILCALIAFTLPKVVEGAGEVVGYVVQAVRAIPGFAIFGVIYFYFDAKSFSGCTMVPDEWIGYAVWVVGPFALLGILFGVSSPPRDIKPLQVSEYNNIVRGEQMPLRSARRERLERLAEENNKPEQGHNPSLAKKHFAQAGESEARGETEQSIALYTDAIEADENYPLAHFYRGSLLASQGKVDEALADFHRVVELSEDTDLINMSQKRMKKLNESS